MNRYETMFEHLDAANQGAFVPFVTLGDPNFEQSLAIVDALIAGGADALELGFAFSDPVADGSTIQNANVRALRNGSTPSRCIEMLHTIRQRHPDIPIGLLLYANLVYSTGIDNFYQKLANAGIDSVLIADVPTLESKPYRDAATKYGIKSIFIAPPNADDATLKNVAQLGSGYTYLVSRAGVTGTESKAGKPVDHLLDVLKANHAPPTLLGFGIAEPEQVKAAIAAGAAGAISGSAVVKIIEHNLESPKTMLAELKAFVSKMKAATVK
ncbi:tryptophan synthase subunit alpha [Celerinatantimonas diazotrophica]|uniref:Tryptophan synthase alpha chain n=1 Tax=Celerinatantimonas diazotrophica TaxID=412034 RepID=A0A4R1JA75_9GAMM|nr:tryptophan synthase subunit alpha [Celerinatantimonas diazotrophica]TCK47522.1 tryptophan synthase alpha chain [Celerinatantimonas diazotrophica]CAG9296860.1 Tryptophan synthase alpha chain [Celerinatantimonas diazotrophica]